MSNSEVLLDRSVVPQKLRFRSRRSSDSDSGTTFGERVALEFRVKRLMDQRCFASFEYSASGRWERRQSPDCGGLEQG